MLTIFKQSFSHLQPEKILNLAHILSMHYFNYCNNGKIDIQWWEQNCFSLENQARYIHLAYIKFLIIPVFLSQLEVYCKVVRLLNKHFFTLVLWHWFCSLFLLSLQLVFSLSSFSSLFLISFIFLSNCQTLTI